MNYGVGKNYSVFLTSLRENAPYADALDPITGMLIPQAREKSHEPQRQGVPNRRTLISLPRRSLRQRWAVNHAERIVDGEKEFALLTVRF
jgi:hypothetical protein